MTRFANTSGPRSPMRTTSRTTTHEGGEGWNLDQKTRLFTLSVSSLLNPRFYDQTDGVAELASLANLVSRQDPDWMQKFIPWVRKDMNMRTAPVIMLAEYVAAQGPGARKLIAETLTRADEPAELLGYWLTRYGKAMPMQLKRGLADAVTNLTTEYAALKYGTDRNAVTLADVIELTHPTPKGKWQSQLFTYLLDQRHGVRTVSPSDYDALGSITEHLALMAVPEDQRQLPPTDVLNRAGWTWERLSGYTPNGMDAAAWEAIIPTMGYMALLRNLRNFEEAGISADATHYVQAKLGDPVEVANSRQFPYRFYNAWKANQSMTYASVLESAAQLSLNNVPVLDGRTLILIDVSGSMGGAGHMWGHLTQHGRHVPFELAALFGGALYLRNKESADLVAFATSSTLVHPGGSVLRLVDAIEQKRNRLGGGTNMWQAVDQHYNGHDRVVVFTDMQSTPMGAARPPSVRTHIWDLVGYGVANVDLSQNNFLYAGFTDQMFKIMEQVERVGHHGWPWEGATS